MEAAAIMAAGFVPVVASVFDMDESATVPLSSTMAV
jgi:hypothetical protein